jgi:hypothetical protein
VSHPIPHPTPFGTITSPGGQSLRPVPISHALAALPPNWHPETPTSEEATMQDLIRRTLVGAVALAAVGGRRRTAGLRTERAS